MHIYIYIYIYIYAHTYTYLNTLIIIKFIIIIIIIIQPRTKDLDFGGLDSVRLQTGRETERLHAMVFAAAVLVRDDGGLPSADCFLRAAEHKTEGQTVFEYLWLSPQGSEQQTPVYSFVL